ncbi:MAG: translation initiation factor IF-2, partial [Patescibacteria group bacterium]
ERYTVSSAQTSPEDGQEKKGKKTLNIVVKADVLGSLEAIIGSLEKIKHDEVGVKIIGKGLGNITENDVSKAQAGGASVLGFHVNATSTAEELMRDEKISFLRYDVIYDLINWVKDELEKLLDAEKIVTELGNLKVLGIFHTEKNAITVGGRVENGKAKKKALVRIKRNGEIIGPGEVAELQQGKQSVKEVSSGTECGLKIESKTKIEEGDVLEFYSEESKIRKIIFG